MMAGEPEAQVGSAQVTVVVSDYWSEDFAHRPHASYARMLRDERDEPLSKPAVLDALIDFAGALDGDEIEITIKKTGRRPFGDRRVVLVEPHTYRREKP